MFGSGGLEEGAQWDLIFHIDGYLELILLPRIKNQGLWYDVTSNILDFTCLAITICK